MHSVRGFSGECAIFKIVIPVPICIDRLIFELAAPTRPCILSDVDIHVERAILEYLLLLDEEPAALPAKRLHTLFPLLWCNVAMKYFKVLL